MCASSTARLLNEESADVQRPAMIRNVNHCAQSKVSIAGYWGRIVTYAEVFGTRCYFRIAGNRPATMECQGEKPTLWGPTREYQCFYDVQSQGVEREICERTNAQDGFKR